MALWGNQEPDRVQSVIDKIRAAGMDIPADLEASDITTNEFIDESIGLPEMAAEEEAPAEEPVVAWQMFAPTQWLSKQTGSPKPSMAPSTK